MTSLGVTLGDLPFLLPGVYSNIEAVQILLSEASSRWSKGSNGACGRSVVYLAPITWAPPFTRWMPKNGPRPSNATASESGTDPQQPRRSA